MIEQINNPDAPPKNIVLNTELIIGNSNSRKEVAG
jgi:DNA-binding LacI/PurR family transcriptional regulator